MSILPLELELKSTKERIFPAEWALSLRRGADCSRRGGSASDGKSIMKTGIGKVGPL
jgi:hypothetical protein